MKLKKPWNLFAKIRPKMREIYRFSPIRREAIKCVTQVDPEQGKFFECAQCKSQFPIEMAEVDHIIPCGSLQSWADLTPWTKRLFEGAVQVLDKRCHKSKSAAQRRKL